jgi:putative NADPH-quinone reductase
MKVYVVHAHVTGQSFSRVCALQVCDSLRAAGHEVRLSDLHDDGFDPTLPLEERRGQFEPPESKPVVAPYADHLRWAEGIVLVYPTWWSGQPALLKGWFDRVWVSGLAYNPPDGNNHITAKLTNIRRLMVVTTHGSSKWVNAIQGEPGKRVVFRALRVLCHPLARTSWIALYTIDRSTDQDRAAFLRRIDRAVRRFPR